MVELNTAISVMTLNASSIHNPFKRTVIFRLDKKQDQSVCYLQVRDFKCEDTSWLKVKDGQRYIMQNTKHHRAGVTILVSDKGDIFKTRNIIRNKLRYFMIKSIYQE